MTWRGTFSHKELHFGNDSFTGKNAFEKSSTKTELVNGKSYMKSYIQNCSQHCPCTFPDSYAQLHSLVFAKKTFYMKLTTFSTAKETKSKAKPVDDSESKSKRKMRSRWTLFLVLLMSAVICL